MVGASLRNTLARRNHKERAQPLHRKRLGLLEKHKDYVQRAKDYNSKQARIQKLREKAAFRNKDEFYFGMVKGRTEGGIAVGDRGNKALDHELVRLLKTQDGGYLHMQIAKDQNRIEKIKAELEISAPEASGSGWDASAEVAEVEKLAGMGVVLSRQQSSKKGKGKDKDVAGHLLFADSLDETQENVDNGPTEDGVSHEQELDLGWEEPRKKVAKPRKSNLPTEEELALAEEEARERRLQLLTELSALLNRVKVLHQAAAKLEITKSHMSTKGGRALKVREAKWVDDETQEEDRNGERRRWEGKLWKWKLERRR